MTCLCDQLIFPPELTIAAGLRTIPRQFATFPEFRAAMLAALSSQPALSDWRARESGDLGIMLLEMWAYVCDSVSFYDETIANECYVRTSRLRPSLRKLVGLLGYVPRPAIGATGWLAAFADGRQPVKLPAGTAFRSGAFDGQAPQVFELDAETSIHPYTNSWTLAPVRPAVLATSPYTAAGLLLDPPSVRLKAADLVYATWPGGAAVRTAKAVAPYDGKDSVRYSRVEFDAPLTLPANTPVDGVKLSKPATTGSLWKATPIGSDFDTILETGVFGMWVFLDAPYRQITAGTTIILSKGAENRWFSVLLTFEMMRTVKDATTTTIKDGGGNVTGSVTTPPVTTPVTLLILDADINDPARKQAPSAADWTTGDASDITLHFGLTDAGTVRIEANTALQAGDPLVVGGRLEEPPKPPGRFLFEDANNDGLPATGTLDFTNGSLQLDQTVVWDQPLAAPVSVYGNVIAVSRGETVPGEVLGSGDGSLSNQSFTLKKKPLTYRSSPTAGNELGAVNTLEVYVDGVRWSEVPTFFGARGDDEVYIVRQTDDGGAVVTFGDGTRGRRLPTGAANVVARYRFGAGLAAPPAGSIHQLAKAVKGLKSVRNPVAVAGGADAEDAGSLRKYAPRSALLLGRVVSIEDMEAAAATVGGVRALHAEWSWNTAKQRPVVQIYYIGKAELATTIAQKVRGLADPTMPIDVQVAAALASELSIDVLSDRRYLADDVAAAVRSALMDPAGGPLAPENIGIGLPLYRSRVFAAALGVSGALSVTGLLLNGAPFPDFAVSPGPGNYFDFEAGSLVVSGKADVHG